MEQKDINEISKQGNALSDRLRPLSALRELDDKNKPSFVKQYGKALSGVSQNVRDISQLPENLNNMINYDSKATNINFQNKLLEFFKNNSDKNNATCLLCKYSEKLCGDFAEFVKLFDSKK